MSATDPTSVLNISAELEALIESAGTTAELTNKYENDSDFQARIEMAIFNSMTRGGKDAYLEAIELFEHIYLG